MLRVSFAEDVGEGTLSIWNIVPQFLFISVAEVMLTVTGLDFAYSQVPPSVRAIVTSCYWLTLAVGSQLQTALAEVKFTHPYVQYFVSAAFIFIVFIGFSCVSASVARRGSR
jgi:dipeptide/tripeptide permease